MADKKYLVEYTEWLDAELTRRYRTTQAKAGKSRGRNALADVAVTEEVFNHPFKVSIRRGDSGNNTTKEMMKIVVAGGFVYGYEERYGIGFTEIDFDLNELDFSKNTYGVYLRLRNNTVDEVIDEISIYFGEDIPYNYSNNRYAYRLAEIEKGSDGVLVIRQVQFSTIVTPFRPMDYHLDIHESLQPLLCFNESGQLALPKGVDAGKVLAVNSSGNAVEWITVSGGVAEIGVITSSPDDGSGTAKWAPITLSSDGSYTISGPSEDVILPEY